MKPSLFFLFSFLTLLSICKAQIPVSQEPLHHNIFESPYVRVLDVHIPPGDTTQIHIHATPSVFVVLNNVKTGSQIIIEEDHTKSPIPHYGNIWFEGFYQQARIHRVWNNDRSEFHVMDIELPNKKFRILDSPIHQSSFTYLFDEKPVRAYKLKLIPGTAVSLRPRSADILMIQLTDTKNIRVLEFGVQKKYEQEKELNKKGDFIYFHAGNAITMKNTGMSIAEFAFFELK